MIYKVWYQSMTAFYGPKVIEASCELEAREKFNARGAFNKNEFCLIEAKQITLQEAMKMATKQVES